MLGWFHALMPKEERFFDLFAQHSRTLVAGAEALRSMLDGGDMVPHHYRSVMDRENEADQITREVLTAARQASEWTHGAFDITFASVGFLYDYRAGKRPTDAQLECALQADRHRLRRLLRQVREAQQKNQPVDGFLREQK